MTEPRIPLVSPDEIDDAQLRVVLDRAARLSTPKPAWYQTLAHSPEMANAYAAFWDTMHRGGRVEHTTKELMRIAIASLLDCQFCADQRSVVAQEQGLAESDAQACALPTFDHEDPRVRAAVRYARLWPRALDQNRPTSADVRAQALVARAQERMPAARVGLRLHSPDTSE